MSNSIGWLRSGMEEFRDCVSEDDDILERSSIGLVECVYT